MRTPSLTAFIGLCLFLGCTSESTPNATPGVTAKAVTPDPEAAAATTPEAASATTANWIVYEMPG